ncbi:Spermine synthase [Crinalium epipsammum PCC 9333]|uniref:Polyamine aminopropyltransferase n=1 Tax=Crinalium epipsammum PCC 9333 TaxID=1173022 RepID=K9W5S4_9CYAN|nr:spermine synthase [Crinalium epipsammum]AFZ15092.1 Spermine synthase [Crinalium epipsammum PCC 9333]
MASLFIEQHINGIAFYINGDLQFDTADEAIYHEYLVIPALTLAIERFPNQNLKVLICGGGDGLAAREVLRFSQVSHIDLVDYSHEVIELGKTTFEPYNAGSLESDKLTIYLQDAFDFISEVPSSSYHAVICDFTYPTRAEDTKIYSQEWFQNVNLAVQSGGIVATNGVSPENRATGFWCLYQTILASGLIAKPLQLSIPSFRHNGYGNWGFFLASQTAISKAELSSIDLPDNLQVLNIEELLSAFKFDSAIANLRHHVNIHSLKCPQLFYYLLNSTSIIAENAPTELNAEVNFLDIQEQGNGKIGTRDWLELESTAQAWLEQFNSANRTSTNSIDINKLIPIQHRYHSPQMRTEWLAYIKRLLGEIDLQRLLNSLLSRAQELPPHIAAELKQLSHKIRSGEPISNLSSSTSQFLLLLSATLIMANLVIPDAVFGKGYYGSSSSSSSNSSDSYEADYTPIILNAQQSTGLSFMGLGSLFLVLFGLTFIDWTNSNDE